MRRIARAGITAKLFAAFLGVTLIVVVAMVVTARYTFREDFLDYARQRQQARVEALAGMLADYYAENGSWSEFRDAEDWRELLRESAWRVRQPGERRADRDHRGDDDDEHGRDDGERHMAFGLAPALLDAGGDRVAGPVLPSGATDRVPVRIAGATVGWLAYRPAERITDRIALRFQREQFEAAWITGLAVMALAAVVSLLLARGFLAPVGRLKRATHDLTAGRFDARVHEPRRDELGQLARDFNRLAQTLERNERLRRQFMADMSHELRTPLSVLRAGLEAIEDGVRPLTRESLGGLQRNLAALSKLVDDLYDLSLADAGALAYRMVELELGSLVGETVEHWRPRFEAAELALSVELPHRPVAVIADQQRLGQLLGNLLRNSLQYTDGGGRVRVALGIEGDEAVLRLEDSAPGVAAADRARLFERLYRVEGSRSRASGGAGLGLAICERIAQAHDGRLEAYESPLGGLGIRLYLPLAGNAR